MIDPRETLAECVHQAATLRRLGADWSDYEREIKERMLEQGLTRVATRQEWVAELSTTGELEVFSLRLAGVVPTHR